MKDEDLSLILKNVMTADSGTYDCHVIQERRSYEDRMKLIGIIYLRVDPPSESVELSVRVIRGLVKK